MMTYTSLGDVFEILPPQGYEDQTPYDHAIFNLGLSPATSLKSIV